MNYLKSVVKNARLVQKTLRYYEYEWTCLSCGYNVIKGKTELTKFQRKKVNFVYCLKYAQQKTFCNCIDDHIMYEDDRFKVFIEVFSELKNKKLNVKNESVEKNQIKQSLYSKTV